ncbi:uncharacterized protein LOC142597416 isoform X1 [Dermatophagoides farinae]|uniref:uncharacterized protein LOC142597416 isoform X1 n=1 Tax=Dermatophagoides farinae TaxID=6954 RepID=UPI003F630302
MARRKKFYDKTPIPSKKHVISSSSSSLPETSGQNIVKSSNEQHINLELLQLLYFYDNLVQLMLLNQKECEQIQKDNEWINQNMKIVFRKIVEKNDVQSKMNDFPNKFMTWKNLKKSITTTFNITNNAKHLNVDQQMALPAAMTKSKINVNRKLHKNIEKLSRLAKKKSCAFSMNKPRTLTIISDDDDESDSDISSTTSESSSSESLIIEKKDSTKNVEQLVINCDPFNCMPSTSNGNGHQIRKSISTINATDTSSPNVLAMRIAGNQYIRPIIPNIDQLMLVNNQYQQQTSTLINNKLPIFGQIMINDNRIPVSQSSISNEQVLPTLSTDIRPKQPFTGKVLLFNSRPILVQNGDQVQLPVISNNSQHAPLPILVENFPQPNNKNGSSSTDQSTWGSTKKSPPEIIKIEDSDDEDDNHNKVASKSKCIEKKSNESHEQQQQQCNHQSYAVQHQGKSSKQILHSSVNHPDGELINVSMQTLRKNITETETNLANKRHCNAAANDNNFFLQTTTKCLPTPGLVNQNDSKSIKISIHKQKSTKRSKNSKAALLLHRNSYKGNEMNENKK